MPLYFDFKRCGINVLGTAVSESDGHRRVVVPIGNNTIATVQARPHAAGTAWGTAVLNIRAGNFENGPFGDFSTVQTIAAGGGITGRIAVSGYHYLAVDVTTAEGADEYADIAICLAEHST